MFFVSGYGLLGLVCRCPSKVQVSQDICHRLSSSDNDTRSSAFESDQLAVVRQNVAHLGELLSSGKLKPWMDDQFCRSIALELLEGLRSLAKSESNQEVAKNNCVLYNLRSEIMRVIANLSACYPSLMPNIVIETNTLPLILNQTVIRDDNPFLPQWAILAVKYLTNESLEIQRQVASIRANDTKKTLYKTPENVTY